MGPGLVRATAKTPGLVQAGIDHRPLVLGGEDRPQDEGLLQKEEGGDAVLVHVAQLTEETTRRCFWWPLHRRRIRGLAQLRRGVGPHPPEGEGNRRVTASGEGWGGTARIRAITG